MKPVLCKLLTLSLLKDGKAGAQPNESAGTSTSSQDTRVISSFPPSETHPPLFGPVPQNTEIVTASMSNGDNHPISSSPYETEVVKILVGPTGGQRVFLVHLGILNQASSLSNKMRPATAAGGHSSISLVDTDPVVFELAVRFLYTGKYQGCSYPTQNFPSLEQDNANKRRDANIEFRIHSFLYCFAREYGMDELSALALTNIQNMTEVPFLNVLAVAKEAYPKLLNHGDDDMYREKFRHETRVAMEKNNNLIREPWILDVFRNEHGNLAVDLFTTLTEPLMCDPEANNREPSVMEEPLGPPQSGKVKRENSHLDDDHADYCVQEPPAEPEIEEPVLSAPQEPVAGGFPGAVSEGYPRPLETEPAEEFADIGKPTVDDGWGSWGSSAKISVKRKGKQREDPSVEITEPEPLLEPEPEPKPVKSSKGKKGKKVKKGKKGGEILAAEPTPELDVPPIEQRALSNDFPPTEYNHKQPQETPGDNHQPPEEEPHPSSLSPPPPLSPQRLAEEESPTTPHSPSATFMLGDTDAEISKARYFNHPCSRRKVHLRSESFWMDCIRCRNELGSLARGIAAGIAEGKDDAVGGEPREVEAW